MKNFITKLRTLAEFIIGFGLGYLALSFPFKSPLLNICLIMVSIFVLLQGLGSFDELNGYGQSNHHEKDKPNH